LYIGYYQEDRINNPEGPTVGVILFSVPSAGGAFSGQMPFSYAGCSDGIDTGAISGTRSDDALSGSWQGTMDGQRVGGAFSAGYTATGDRFDGSFTNAQGKIAISVGACHYFVAAQGRFTAYGATTSDPAAFQLSVTDSTTPTFSWPALPAVGGYQLRLFDRACLETTPAAQGCFLGELGTNQTAVEYTPAAGVGAQPLEIGKTYLAVVTAQRADGGFVGFASLEFVPSTTPVAASSLSITRVPAIAPVVGSLVLDGTLHY
jgi:hypothetical protein